MSTFFSFYCLAITKFLFVYEQSISWTMCWSTWTIAALRYNSLSISSAGTNHLQDLFSESSSILNTDSLCKANESPSSSSFSCEYINQGIYCIRLFTHLEKFSFRERASNGNSGARLTGVSYIRIKTWLILYTFSSSPRRSITNGEKRRSISSLCSMPHINPNPWLFFFSLD